MAKLKKVTDSAPDAAEDLAGEAQSLLKRLVDESQLRDAVEKLIDEAQARAEELPARGREARKQVEKTGAAARKQVEKTSRKARKQAKKEAEKQLKAAKAKATKQQQKLARKSAGLAAEGRVLAQQKKPGIKGRLALVAISTIGALTVSETLRSKLLDLLFGAEEEFSYTPPEPPIQDPPASAA